MFEIVVSIKIQISQSILLVKLQKRKKELQSILFASVCIICNNTKMTTATWFQISLN